MCVIVYVPANVPMIDEAQFKDCWDTNPHGFGVTYLDDLGAPVVYKTLDRQAALVYYNTHLKDKLLDRNVLLHFRITTHGGTNLENCHPFYSPSGQHIVMHNGIISGFGDTECESDTRHFIRTCYPALEQYRHDKSVMDFFAGGLRGSKLASLDVTSGDVWLVNENAGVWNDNVWYSNDYSFFRPSLYGSRLGALPSRRITKLGRPLTPGWREVDGEYRYSSATWHADMNAATGSYHGDWEDEDTSLGKPPLTQYQAAVLGVAGHSADNANSPDDWQECGSCKVWTKSKHTQIGDQQVCPTCLEEYDEVITSRNLEQCDWCNAYYSRGSIGSIKGYVDGDNYTWQFCPGCAWVCE